MQNNTLSNITTGFAFFSSNNNIVSNNNLSNVGTDITLDWFCNGNTIFHNSLGTVSDNGINYWDNNYPSGGNYWFEYSGIDLYYGFDQNIPGSDGIGDSPYILDGDTQDNYPLMTPWTPPLPLTEFDIPLTPGWNLVSIPLEMADTSVLNVLASISGQWDTVKSYDATDYMDHWKTFRVGSSMNDLVSIDNTMGFWIHATAACNLTVSGAIPVSTSIPLYAGWNLVGYPTLNENMTVGEALWGTGADSVEVFDPVSPFIREVGSTYVMTPGNGYWVHVVADTVWS